MSNIGERIRTFRKSIKLTQIEFGHKIGIVQGHLTGIETGKKTVTAKTVKVICGVYGISERWLRTGESEMLLNAANDKKSNKFVNIFKELDIEYQDFVLQQTDSLIAIQEKRNRK